MKTIRWLWLVALLPLAGVQARTIAELRLEAEEEGAPLVAKKSGTLPLHLPTRLVSGGENRVVVGTAAEFGGNDDERVVRLEKHEGSGNVSVEWTWSPFVLAEDSALEIAFRLYLSPEPGQQGNLMIGVNADTSGKILAYLQISPDGSLAMLVAPHTTERRGKLAIGSPNDLKVRIDYQSSEATLFLDGEPLSEPVKFNADFRAQQFIVFSPGEMASRCVGLTQVQINEVP